MATFTEANNRYQQSFTLTKQSGSTLEIPIAGKYANKNIFLTLNVQTATVTAGSAQADVNISEIDDTSKSAINIHSSIAKQTAEPNTGYFIAMDASASGNSEITRAGWVSTGNLTSASTTTTKYFSINSASATITTSGSIPTASLVTGSNSISGKTKLTFTPQTTTNISVPYYATFSVTKAQGTINFNKTIDQVGYLGSTSQISINQLTIPSQQTTYYIPIAAASASNAATVSATINSVNFEYNSTDFNLTGSTAITGTATLSVTKAGWLPVQDIIGSVTGDAVLSVTVPKIGIKASTTGGGARKPTISRTTTTASGATNVGSAAATTAAPSSGYFVSVQSAANTTTLTAIPAVSSNGYGTTQYYGATTATTTVGAAASDITYIPITSGTGSANSASAEIGLVATDGTAAGVNISGIIGTKTNSEPTSGYYLAFSATGSGSSKVTTGGWFPVNTVLPTASTAVTRYFPVATATLAITGGGLSASTGHAALSSDGYYNGSAIDSNDKIELTQASTSGYYKITASGYGEVIRADIKKEITKAGYLPKDTAASVSIANSSASSNTGIAAYYIKKSTLSTTAVTSSNTDQNITISAGYYPTDRTVKVNKMTTQTPTTSYTYSGMTTYFDTSTTSTGASVTITPRYSNSAGYVAAHSNANNGGIGYWKIKSSTITSTTTTVATNNVVTRGKYTYGAGWVSASTTLPIATFANTATSGQTYVDISNTTEAPILISEDYLYINKGYTDNLKISLAKLIPDAEGTTAIGAGHILQGYAAYNYAGTLLSGTIPTRSSANTSVNGKGVTIPYGYYPEQFVINISDGAYKSEVSLSDVSVTPAINLHANATSTYGFTTTAPTSGTNGTNFLTLDPTSNAPTYSATGTATITTAGYLATGNKKSNTTKTVGVNGGTSYYIPIITPSFSGGGLNVSKNQNTVSTTAVVTVSSTGTFITNGTATYGVVTTQPDGTDGTDYLSIDGKGAVTTTGKVTSSVTVGRNNVTYTNSAGVIAAHSDSLALNNSSTSTGTAVNVTPSVQDNFSPLYMPIVSPTFGGGGLTKTDYSTTPTVSLSSGSDTNMTVNLGSKNTATYAYYFKVHGKTDKITGNTSVTRGKVTYTNDAGAIQAHSNAQALAESTTSPSVTVNATSADTYVNIKAASASRSGSATATTPTATRTTATVSGAYNVGTGSATTTAPASGDCFVSFTVTAPATTIPLTTTISTSGYLATTNQISGSATANAKTSGTYYINVPKATVTSSNGTANATATAGTAKIDTSPSVSSTASYTITGIDTSAYSTTTTSTYKIVVSASATANSGKVSATGGSASASVSASNITITPGYNTATATIATSASNTGTKTGSNTATTPVNSNTSTSATIYLKQASFNYSGGSLTDKTATAGFTSISTTSSDAYNNGLKVSTIGKAGRAAVSCTNTAGYFPAHTSAQTVSAVVTATTWSGAEYFLKGVTLTKPSSGTAKFDVTVPNGDSTITFQFQVTAAGEVFVIGPD